MQQFVDVALTTTEDHLTTHKLTTLRIVGNAVADFVAELHVHTQKQLSWMTHQSLPPEDVQDKSLELIRLCDNLWLALEQHPQLPLFLVRQNLLSCFMCFFICILKDDCRRNLQLYKNIKDAQGHVQRTTLEELSAINNDGCFVIGNKRGIDVSSDISNIFQLILDKEVDKSHKIYNLGNLQDLESRLVLLAGQSSENTKQVHKFLNVSECY